MCFVINSSPIFHLPTQIFFIPQTPKRTSQIGPISVLTNISRSSFSDGRHRSIKPNFLLCTLFCRCTRYNSSHIDMCALSMKEKIRVGVAAMGCELMFTQPAQWIFSTYIALMYALQPCFEFFLFLISNRALVLPSEREKRKKSLIEIYTVLPFAHPTGSFCDANRVNISPMIHFCFSL